MHLTWTNGPRVPPKEDICSITLPSIIVTLSVIQEIPFCYHIICWNYKNLKWQAPELSFQKCTIRTHFEDRFSKVQNFWLTNSVDVGTVSKTSWEANITGKSNRPVMYWAPSIYTNNYYCDYMCNYIYNSIFL